MIRNCIAAGLVLFSATLGMAGDNLKGTKVLNVGGGSSHDYNRWFNQEDSAILAAAGARVEYTDKTETVREKLAGAKVLCLSINQPWKDKAAPPAIMDFAQDPSKGILIVHAGTWYNWKDWNEYNRVLVSGGARGHDRLGEFEVTVTDPKHPIMKGVPKTFKITDELYNFIPDETSPSSRIVLATGKSPVTGKVFPLVWITKGPKAKIVCITLGHDARAHELPAYRAILTNSANWVAGR